MGRLKLQGKVLLDVKGHQIIKSRIDRLKLPGTWDWLSVSEHKMIKSRNDQLELQGKVLLNVSEHY